MDKSRRSMNYFSLDFRNIEKNNSQIIQKTLEILYNDKLVILNGVRNSGKIYFLKQCISNIGAQNSYFYYNGSDDIGGEISDNEKLSKHLHEFSKLYNKPQIIVLQDISEVKGVKDFITQVYDEGYRILLIGNDIKIGGIKEIEVIKEVNISDENYMNTLKFGRYNEVQKIEEIELKQRILKLLTNEIFLKDIFQKFGVKNIDLYNFTLGYLAYFNTYHSLRELQRNITELQSISLKTLIDYIDFSLQEKIIKRVYRYDQKNNKTIESKAKYYFSDGGIRNSLIDFELSQHTLQENLVFNLLEYNNYSIYGGLNGKFQFSFYGERDNEKVFIHLSEQTTREELKKEVNKLNKIGKQGRKYLLINSIKELGIKKLKYNDVEIVEVEDFMKSFGK